MKFAFTLKNPTVATGALNIPLIIYSEAGLSSTPALRKTNYNYAENAIYVKTCKITIIKNLIYLFIFNF